MRGYHYVFATGVLFPSGPSLVWGRPNMISSARAMRTTVKLLLLLLCVTSLPDSLPAQLGLEEVLIDSTLINHPDPQKRLAGEIAAAQAALARKESSAGAQSPEMSGRRQCTGQPLPQNRGLRAG